MSNLQELEGKFINLDLVEEIGTTKTGTTGDNYRVIFKINGEWDEGERNSFQYENKSKAKERIREIIKMQNGVSRGFFDKQGNPHELPNKIKAQNGHRAK